MSGPMQMPGADDLEEILVATLAAVDAEGLSGLHAAIARHPQHERLLRDAVAALGLAGDGLDAEVSQPTIADFEIGEEIGRGAMGVVHAARQISLGRRVAIKMLPGCLASDPVAIARFRREAQAVARLKHPGIVQVHGFGEEGGRPWLAMELVDGIPLDQLVAEMRAAAGQTGRRGFDALLARVDNARGGAASWSTKGGRHPAPGGAVGILGGIVAQVADALGYAHAHGIVHRDVKPSNILLRPQGSALVVDFGLAHDDLGASLTRTGQIAGTPHYMAPEQTLAAGATSPRSDVFSLGVVLYELLTLERPFSAGSEAGVLERVRLADPVRPTRLNPALPRDLEAVLQRALEKDPAARYADAGLFAADIRAALRGEMVTARRLGPIRRAMRQAVRRPVATTLVALLVIGVPTVTALIATLWAQRPLVALAEAAAEYERRELLLARIHTALASHAPGPAESALVTLAGAAPVDMEMQIWRIAALAQAGRAAEASALAEATTSSAEIRTWAQQLVRCYGGDLAAARQAEPELPEPTTALGVWVAATAISTRAARDHDGAAMRRAQALLLRANLSAQRPRLVLQKQLVSAAKFTGDADLARGVADALLAQGGDSVETLTVLGEAQMLFDPVAAERTAKALRAAGGPLASGALLLAQALRLQGRADEATAALCSVPTGDPRHGDLCYQRAAWCLEDGDLVGATEGFTIALRENPQSVFAAMGLANVHNRSKDHDAAIGALGPFVDRHPKHARLQTIYADALLAKGRLDEALERVDRVVEAEPGYDYAPLTKAQVLVKLGRPGEARRALIDAVQARPESAFRWHALAMFELDGEKLPGRDLDGGVVAARRSIGWSRVNRHVYWWDLIRLLAAAGRWPEVREESAKLQAELEGATDARSLQIMKRLATMAQRASTEK